VVGVGESACEELKHTTLRLSDATRSTSGRSSKCRVKARLTSTNHNVFITELSHRAKDASGASPSSSSTCDCRRLPAAALRPCLTWRRRRQADRLQDREANRDRDEDASQFHLCVIRLVAVAAVPACSIAPASFPLRRLSSALKPDFDAAEPLHRIEVRLQYGAEPREEE